MDMASLDDILTQKENDNYNCEPEPKYFKRIYKN